MIYHHFALLLFPRPVSVISNARSDSGSHPSAADNAHALRQCTSITVLTAMGESSNSSKDLDATLIEVAVDSLHRVSHAVASLSDAVSTCRACHTWHAKLLTIALFSRSCTCSNGSSGVDNSTNTITYC
eukprot:13206-Heterococcus_DN1.PRE.11